MPPPSLPGSHAATKASDGIDLRREVQRPAGKKDGHHRECLAPSACRRISRSAAIATARTPHRGGRPDPPHTDFLRTPRSPHPGLSVKLPSTLRASCVRRRRSPARRYLHRTVCACGKVGARCCRRPARRSSSRPSACSCCRRHRRPQARSHSRLQRQQRMFVLQQHQRIRAPPDAPPRDVPAIPARPTCRAYGRCDGGPSSNNPARSFTRRMRVTASSSRAIGMCAGLHLHQRVRVETLPGVRRHEHVDAGNECGADNWSRCNPAPAYAHSSR